MSLRQMRYAVLFVTLAGIGLAATPVSNMSGTWFLKVQDSRWGQHPKPVSSVVTIVHDEPALEYSGTVTEANPEHTRQFHYQGAIDGKDHPVEDTAGERTMRFERVTASTVRSTLKTRNGAVLETATMTISSDGKTMRRSISAAGPNGEVVWVEIYERR